MFGVGGNKNASQTVAQILIGGITGKEGVVRVECSLGACAAVLTGSFPPAVAKEARDPAALLCFLTGVDEQTKATANKIRRLLARVM